MSISYRNGEDPKKSEGSDEYPNTPTHFRPIFTDEGDLWIPRWLSSLLDGGKIDAKEFTAVARIIDQTKGWRPATGRFWVRLTRADLAKLTGLSKPAAARVRDSLLEKGLIRRRKASEAPEAQREQKRTGYHYTYTDPSEAQLEEIKKMADPEQTDPEQTEGSEQDSDTTEADATARNGKKIPERQEEIPF